MDEWVVGIDLGGTKIDVGLVSPEDKIIERRRIPTQAWEGPQRVVERISACISDLVTLLPAGKTIAALGICSPGPVDHESGMLIDPPNLSGLHNAPLQPLLSERLGIPVRLEHDAKAAALGELYFGAGRGEQNLVYIVVGTGVGGAIIANGQLFRGPFNSAGEIGHVTLDRDGELCSCGSRGCVETFISGPWLARRYQRLLDAHGSPDAAPDAAQLDPAPGAAPHAANPITGERVVMLADQGDKLACQVMEQAGEALGVATATLAMVLNIDLFVIGGSVAKSGDLLLEPARRAIPHHCYRSVGCEIRIVPAALVNDGPILGCAWLARQALRDALPAAHTTMGVTTVTTMGSIATAAAPGSVTSAERAALESVEGYVFDVQRFSLHDGPGVRTNVFLKGCPLRCPWCANPESQHLQPDLMLSAAQCITCGLFSEPCTATWEKHLTARPEQYSGRVDICPTCALRWSGERRTAGQIMADVLRDVPFYEGGGGLTLTGGEPTFQPRLAEALLRLAKAHGLTTAIETSGHTRWKVLERLLPHLDTILFDVKHLDSAAHQAVIGVDNVLILSNLRRLAALGAPVTVRVPLIPGFNATEAYLDSLAQFIIELDGLDKSVCLLPYHTFGRAKYKALHREYPWEGHARLTEAEVEHFAQRAASHGLRVSVGG
jgi:glycyl-radical enzyme activating protein/glucokinase-like ROK family protein